MPLIVITGEAHNAIRSRAPAGFDVTGQQQQDGSWVVPIGLDTMSAIQNAAFPHETLSDTIVRLARGKSS